MKALVLAAILSVAGSTVVTAQGAAPAAVTRDSTARTTIGRTARITLSVGRITVGELRSAGPAPFVMTKAACRTATRRKHTWLGAALGFVVGSGIGYLVAVPRVRATERRGDAPFEQIEYVIDPAVGGILGAVVGGIIGAHMATPRCP